MHHMYMYIHRVSYLQELCGSASLVHVHFQSLVQEVLEYSGQFFRILELRSAIGGYQVKGLANKHDKPTRNKKTKQENKQENKITKQETRKQETSIKHCIMQLRKLTLRGFSLR